MGSAEDEEEEYETGTPLSFVLSFVQSLFSFFLCNLLSAQYIFFTQAWAEGKGELATCRHSLSAMV